MQMCRNYIFLLLLISKCESYKFTSICISYNKRVRAVLFSTSLPWGDDLKPLPPKTETFKVIRANLDKQ